MAEPVSDFWADAHEIVDQYRRERELFHCAPLAGPRSRQVGDSPARTACAAIALSFGAFLACLVLILGVAQRVADRRLREPASCFTVDLDGSAYRVCPMGKLTHA